MPTSLRIGPYRFYFYSADGNEPIHIHVDRGRQTAKFWLDPVRLFKNDGFAKKEINDLYKIVYENEQFLINKWNEYFN